MFKTCKFYCFIYHVKISHDISIRSMCCVLISMIKWCPNDNGLWTTLISDIISFLKQTCQAFPDSQLWGLAAFYSNGIETLRWLDTTTECGDWSFVSPSVCKCSGALLPFHPFWEGPKQAPRTILHVVIPLQWESWQLPKPCSSSCRIRRQQERCNTWSCTVCAPTAAASLQGMLLPLRWTGTAGWGGIQHTG